MAGLGPPPSGDGLSALAAAAAEAAAAAANLTEHANASVTTTASPAASPKPRRPPPPNAAAYSSSSPAQPTRNGGTSSGSVAPGAAPTSNGSSKPSSGSSHSRPSIVHRHSSAATPGGAAGAAPSSPQPPTPQPSSVTASTLSPNHPVNLRSQAKATLDSRFSLKSYLGAANTLLEKAEAADRQGQLEQAFVNYIKSANVASFIPKHDEWPKVLAAKSPTFHRYQDFMHRVPDIISRTKRIEEQLRLREEKSAALRREEEGDAAATTAAAVAATGEPPVDLQSSARPAGWPPRPETPRDDAPVPPVAIPEGDEQMDGLAARLSALRGHGGGGGRAERSRPSSMQLGGSAKTSVGAAMAPPRGRRESLDETRRAIENMVPPESPSRALPGLPEGVASPHMAYGELAEPAGSEGRGFCTDGAEPSVALPTPSQFASTYPTLDDFERRRDVGDDVPRSAAVDGLPPRLADKFGQPIAVPSSAPISPRRQSARPLPSPPSASPAEHRGEARAPESALPPLPRSNHISVEELWRLLNPGFATVTVPGPGGDAEGATQAPVTRMVKKPGRKVLLLDVRSREEWETGRIKSQNAACLEPLWLRAGMSSDEIQSKLILASDAERNAFSQRDGYDLVVLYDRNSRTLPGGTTASSHPLDVVINAIYQNEFRKMLRHQPALLIGGFESWQRHVGESGIVREHGGPRNTSNGGPYFVGSAGVPSPRTAEEETKRARRQGMVLPSPNSGANGFGTLPQYAAPSVPARVYQSPGLSASAAGVASPMPPPGAPSLPPPAARGSMNRADDYMASQPTIPSHEAARSPTRQSSGAFDYPQLRSSPIATATTPQPPPPTASRPAHSRSTSTNSLRQADRALGDVVRRPAPPPSLSAVRAASYSVAPPRLPRDQRISFTGLKNVGNSCYMNATLQCLSATVPLARFMLDGSYKKAINRVNPLGTQGVLVEAFAQLIRVLWSEQYTFVSPVTFREAITRFAPSFRGYDQHDAQEFLAFLLDGLHEDLNFVINKPPPVEMTPAREHELETLPQQVASMKEWAIYRQRNDSLVVDWFQGQFRNKLTCLHCGKTSTTFNPFIFLSLPMPVVAGAASLARRGVGGGTSSGGTTVTLNDCLDAFVRDEVLDKEDRWHCPRCRRAVKAVKKLTLSRFPQVLIIHLKRFSTSGGRIAADIQFPTEGLDLTNYAPPPLPPSVKVGGGGGAGSEPLVRSRSQVPPYVYDLQAAVHHHGSGLNVGHYMATVRSQDHWMLCDDSRVTRTERPAHLAQAYILFFIRRPNSI